MFGLSMVCGIVAVTSFMTQEPNPQYASVVNVQGQAFIAGPNNVLTPLYKMSIIHPKDRIVLTPGSTIKYVRLGDLVVKEELDEHGFPFFPIDIDPVGWGWGGPRGPRPRPRPRPGPRPPIKPVPPMLGFLTPEFIGGSEAKAAFFGKLVGLNLTAEESAIVRATGLAGMDEFSSAAAVLTGSPELRDDPSAWLAAATMSVTEDSYREAWQPVLYSKWLAAQAGDSFLVAASNYYLAEMAPFVPEADPSSIFIGQGNRRWEQFLESAKKVRAVVKHTGIK